jgi:hypothetical protein
MFPHEKALVKRYKNRPFALVGVNSDGDREKLKKMNEERSITWRSFWDGPKGMHGPIAEQWNVTGWPTLFLIDHEGTVRKRWVGSPGNGTLDSAIERLVKKAEELAEAAHQNERDANK